MHVAKTEKTSWLEFLYFRGVFLLHSIVRSTFLRKFKEKICSNKFENQFSPFKPFSSQKLLANVNSERRKIWGWKASIDIFMTFFLLYLSHKFHFSLSHGIIFYHQQPSYGQINIIFLLNQNCLIIIIAMWEEFFLFVMVYALLWRLFFFLIKFIACFPLRRFSFIFSIFLLLLNDLRAHEHNKFVKKKIKIFEMNYKATSVTKKIQ